MSAHQKKVETAKITRDMTQGNPYGHMVAFAMPVLLSQIFQHFYRRQVPRHGRACRRQLVGNTDFFIDKLFYGHLHGRGCRYIPLFRRA